MPTLKETYFFAKLEYLEIYMYVLKIYRGMMHFMYILTIHASILRCEL